MSDLRALSPNGAWLNICESEWKVLQEDGTWKEIEPGNDLRVRHGSNDYWLQINCDLDVGYCPPEQLAGCWPGYSGNFDSAEFKIGGPTGYLVCDCDGLNCKTYTGHTPDYDKAGGRFFSTAPVVENTVAHSLPTTLFGSSEAEITEMLVYAGERSGHIEVSLHDLDPGVRVRIYNDCVLLGDSDVSGPFFNVFFTTEIPKKAVEEDPCGDPPVPNKFLTVRVDAPTGRRWRVKLGAVSVVQATNYERPAPCFGTFGPSLPCFVNDQNNVIPGEAVYENVHILEGISGRVDIDLTVNGPEPVKFEVFYNGGLIGTHVTGNSETLLKFASTLTFNFNPVGGDQFIVVRYSAPRAYNSWTYSMYCPTMQGSRINMRRPMQVPNDVLCLPLNESLAPAHAVTGRGAHTSDIYYNYAGYSLGDIVVEFFAPDEVQFVFFQGNYPNETILSGTTSVVNGHRRFYFRFDPRNGTTVHVRVVGPCCPDWIFTMSNPVPPPVIDVFDASIVRGRAGQVSLLCFDVKLRNKTPKRVTFDWNTAPLTAIVSTDGTCTVTEDVPDSPFCNIVGTGGVRGGSYSNDHNIGYSCSRISSTLHSPNCAQGGQYYVVETDFNFPYTGTYTVVGTADDCIDVYVACKHVLAGPRGTGQWERTHRATFTAEAGWNTVSAMYLNIPNCTPGWVKFVILNSSGQVIFATNPTAYTWRSKAGAITVEPPPVPMVYGADYNQVKGSGAIEPCTDSTRVCVPICGTNLMGPDVTFQLSLSKVVNAEIGDLVAIGTIKNGNQYSCDQNTSLAVYDAGLNGYVNRGAHSMFVNQLIGNSGATYVMDADINIPASGLYTIYFHGIDYAEFFIDCNRVAVSSGSAVRIRTPLNSGVRKCHINYSTASLNGLRTGYAAVAIVDSLNRVVYASLPAHWRGRIASAGSPPSCVQFPPCAPISGNSIQQQNSGGGGSTNFTVGYGAVQVRSSLHGNGSQPNGVSYTLQFRPTLPAGSYTLVWSCDDEGDFYVNCQHVASKRSGWRTIQRNAFYISDGSKPTTMSLVYRNTGGSVMWTNFAILNAAGTAVLVSSPSLPNGASAAGNAVAATSAAPLYETNMGGRYVQHYSTSAYSGGPAYQWWIAENEINIPANGQYRLVMGQDLESMQIYIDCALRGQALDTTSGSSGLFTLRAGPNRFIVRKYNAKPGAQDWWWFDLYDAAGNLVYRSRAAGWKAAARDMNFSGIS